MGSLLSRSKGGDSAEKNRQYAFDNKGQFVVIYNDFFKYTHRGTPWDQDGTLGTGSLDYQTDVDNIKVTFQLDDDSVNLKVGKNLTPNNIDGGKTEKQFDNFVDSLLHEKKGYHNPSFLMFFLMSHGDKGGEFLLSDDASDPHTPCCGNDSHTFQGQCRARKVYDLIQKIDSAESQKFRDVPKIFILQTCRGGRPGQAHPLDKGLPTPPSPPPPSEAGRLLPVCSDVFIFYACIEGQLSWVADSRGQPSFVDPGSFLVDNFCKAIADTIKATIRSNLLWRKLCQELETTSDRNDDNQNNLKLLNAHIKEVYGLDKLRLYNENVADGWIEGVCRQATLKVTDIPVHKWGLLIKQQPEYASTLRLKLSMLKLMETQLPIPALV